MYKSLSKTTATAVLCVLGLTIYSGGLVMAADSSADLETAEGMIDAFYSFDPDQLQPFLRGRQLHRDGESAV